MSDERKPGAQGLSRREWLQRVGAAAGAAAVLGQLPGCDGEAASAGVDAGPDDAHDVQQDAASGPDEGHGPDVSLDETTPPEPGLQPLRGDGSSPLHYIDTVVVVQMENRSFDHYFGALALLEGRKDVEGLVAGLSNPTHAGQTVAIRHETKQFALQPDPPHGRKACLAQWAQGACDGFVRSFEEELAELNDTGSPLDLVMTYYGREQLPAFYGLADAFTVCDRWHASLLAPTWPNRFYSHCATSEGLLGNSSPISAPNPYTLLSQHGYTYAHYHADIPVYFALTLESLPLEQHNAAPWEQFFIDAAAGALPNVCVVEPSFVGGDDHPPADIREGQAFVQSIYEALRQSPQWDRCLMVVFYDEHGGFHDHVAPPKALGDARAAEGFDQLGFRVPALVMGPLARRGAVCHTVLDHASVPRLLCDVFDLPQLNERAALAGDIADALTLELVPDAARPAPPALPPVELPRGAFDKGMNLPFGQPELLALAQRRGFIERMPTRRERVASRERYFAWAQQLGAVRWR